MVTETQNNPQPEAKTSKFKKAVKKTFTLIVIRLRLIKLPLWKLKYKVCKIR